MTNKTKLKIGEFSKLMQVTIKTLRHYEQIGLLLPHETDKWTGYRYYTLEQMQRLNTIRSLKRIGFSLEEISDLFANDCHTPSEEQLLSKINSCEEQIRALFAQRKRLISMVNSQKNITKMEKFSIQRLPAIKVASHRCIIDNYEALGALCVNVIGPEMQRLACKCSASGYCFTVEHNNEYNPTNIDIEYCEQVDEMGTDSDIIKFKELPEIQTAVCMKHYGPYNTFYKSFTDVFKYIEENGYAIIGQPRTTYIDGIWNQEDPNKWLSLIQIPISLN